MLSGTTLVLVAFLTVFLMIGIGTTLTVADFQRAVTQPRGVLIGLASQYGWMPLLGYSAAKLANLPNEMAVGLMVMTCASGGNASNLFSWFARADVALSVSMTAIAAVLSVVAMPLLLAAYASGFTTEDLQMPYQQIAATLVGMLVPLGLGMAIRHFRPTWASKLERPGMLSGALMLGIVLWAGAPDMVANVQAMTGQMLGSCLAVAASGMLLGYLAARLGGLASPVPCSNPCSTCLSCTQCLSWFWRWSSPWRCASRIEFVPTLIPYKETTSTVRASSCLRVRGRKRCPSTTGAAPALS
jgi:BASS family bile acid:Na+ symporter